MNWQNFVSSLIGAVAGSGVVGACLSYLFAKKLERFKAGLSVDLFEHQTRFAWPHTERSRALVHLYRLLAKADRGFTDMLRPIQLGGKEEMEGRIKGTSVTANKFFDFYDDNSVFFDPELTQKLRQLQDEYRKVWSTFVPHFGSSSCGEEWRAAWEKLGRDVMPVRSEVARNIQQLLGVKNN
jgi:hypothetical protein